MITLNYLILETTFFILIKSVSPTDLEWVLLLSANPLQSKIHSKDLSMYFYNP